MKIIPTLLLGLALAGCSRESSARAPGYGGPLPSAVAQEALASLRGQVFRDTTFALGGGELTVLDGFAVIRNPVTGTGPVISLSRSGADGPCFVPVLTDGDAADFYRRTTGAAHPTLKGETSEIYRKALGI